MRPIYLLFTLLLAVQLPAQSLIDFDVTEGSEAFDEALRDFMYAGGNRIAKDAYSNFSPIFFGGGFTEEQQTRIASTSVALASLRVSSTAGFVDYLKSLENLAGTAEDPNELFGQFHDALDQLLGSEEVRVKDINIIFATSAAYLESGNLKPISEGRGWKIEGGAPSFVYNGKMLLRIDTVARVQAISAKDTLNIKQTELLVDLARQRVQGKGGRTDWQRVGLDEDVFAILVRYEFRADRLLYESDSAHLQYPQYFEEEILTGTFTDKIQANGIRTDSEYPQFTSNDGYVEIKNIGKNITLFGNFELRGRTVYAIGETGRRAQVRMRIQGSATDRSIVGAGQRFVVRDGETVGGRNIRTTVFAGQDSLFHPSVTMSVNVPERIVELRRTDNSVDRSPFYHSKNEMAIYSDFMNIHLDTDSVVIGKPSVSFQEKPDVIFESGDYYSLREYQFMQDIAATNPLERLYSYRKNNNGGLDDIHADDLAVYFRKEFTAKDIEPLLYELQSRGFLQYDSETMQITIKPKLVHYVEAFREERDYDRMRIVSDTKGPNATMNLATGEIKVSSIKPLELNREKRIAILPTNDELTIKNNRDLDFSGTIYAGNMILTGKDFHYKYGPNHIVLDSVRYIDIFLPTPEDEAETSGEKQSTASRIEHVTGYLLIDAPKNKSGTEDLEYFPSLQTKDVSYIYYDRADTATNYGRDDFYYELQPFSLNGTDSLTLEDLALNGQLNSGGIFPDFDENLSLQEDGSLGFKGDTPEGGRDVYEGRGNFDGELTLSNTGLDGVGKLSYLEATIESDDLKFGLDRTRGTSNAFSLEETRTTDRSVPQVRGTTVDVEFIPYGDSLVVKSTEGEKFDLYQTNDHTLDGDLVLTPDGLKAKGTLDWSGAGITSEDMLLTAFGATADTADVAIKALQSNDRLALKTSNMSASVDFEKQVATFKNNGDDLATELPYNQFRTSIDEFSWDMAGGNVTFKAKEENNRFTSIHPDQDSLTFTGESATYDINSSILEVEGVEYIEVADARIYPGDQKLFVEGGAKITELTDARIVADTANEYHVINRATVNINGRKEYTASGFYEYNVGPHEQEVEFQDIVGSRVGKGARDEKATATRAEGTIDPGDEFYVDNKTQFFGTINLDAGSKTLLFDGYAKIAAEKLPDAQWFTVRSEGDKKDLTLEVKEPKDRMGAPLFTGIYLSKPNRGLYPSLVQALDFRKDHAILDANGLMNYDEDKDVFLFGDSLRIFNEEARVGNLLRFDNAAGKISGDGVLGIGGRLKYIGVKAYGKIAMDMPTGPRVAIEAPPEPEEEEEVEEEQAAPSMFLLEEETVEASDTAAAQPGGTSITIDAPVAASRPEVLAQAMLAVDLILPDKLINMLANDLMAGTFASPVLQLGPYQEFYETGIETIFPQSAERAIAIASVEGNMFEVPRSINDHTFVFPRVPLKWSEDYQSFVSTEKMSGLASVRGNTIGKQIEVSIEIKMPTNGDDRLYIYLKSPSELYYFFGFKDGVLNVTSNNTMFMNELEDTRAKDLIREMPDGLTYEILPVSPATAETFLRRMKSAF